MKRRHTEAERLAHLWREAVYQAVRDVKLTREATKKQRAAARRWIFSPSTRPRSFLWACKQAGLDPDEVRAEVAEC